MLNSDTLVIMARSGMVKELPVFSFGVVGTPQAASHIWPDLEKKYLNLTDNGHIVSVDFGASRMPEFYPWSSVLWLIPDTFTRWINSTRWINRFI